MARPRPAGFSFSEYEGEVLVYVTRPLEDIVAHGNNMGEQARFVARWAEPLLQRALSDEFEPGVVEETPNPRGARRAPKAR
jgi:hypothetical protein